MRGACFQQSQPQQQSRRPPSAAPCPRIFGGPQRTARAVAAAALPPQAMALSAAAAAAAAAGLAAWLDARRRAAKPELVYDAACPFTASVLSRCPTLKAEYRPVPFLTNAHVETIAIAKLRSDPRLPFRREVILTKDGGAVAIDWEHQDLEEHDLPEDAPVIVLLPGLTGGSSDTYVQHAVQQARAVGVRAAVFNSRGTASSPVLTPQFYSASFTDDTREVINHVRARFPRASALFAAGWSLGANILVNYLGEEGDRTPVQAAVSMCNPFELTISNGHLQRGFNKIYDWNLAASLRRIFAGHTELWRGAAPPLRPDLVPAAKTIREFDEAVTIHSFGWPSVDDYYAGSSSALRIPRVAIPLLCIQAANDPIAPADAIPYDAIRANPRVTLAVTPTGGHLGWAAGPGAPFGHPWTDGAVTEWLTSVRLELLKGQVDGSGGGGSRGGDDGAAAGTGVGVAKGGGPGGVALVPRRPEGWAWL
ncbi:MAG: Alpha/Beta hydrolase protein [Monoraphidium minutum]|nr:MAG: Alpha/Beta hydrolase protein [Monoraphidium minutum]